MSGSAETSSGGKGSLANMDMETVMTTDCCYYSSALNISFAINNIIFQQQNRFKATWLHPRSKLLAHTKIMDQLSTKKTVEGLSQSLSQLASSNPENKLWVSIS